jgi:hypothetical protein
MIITNAFDLAQSIFLFLLAITLFGIGIVMISVALCEPRRGIKEGPNVSMTAARNRSTQTVRKAVGA